MHIRTPARPGRRSIVVALMTAVMLLACAGVAAAHVTVNPSQASAGSYTKLTFQVPNESDTAGTVGLTVALPSDHPLASVSVKKVPGWTVTPTQTTLPAPVAEGNITIKEAVTSITWTADAGTSIGPGEFAEFDISVGPIPDVQDLQFPATQTYSDGTVVTWNEQTPASGEEPEHPVPTLTVQPAAQGDAASEQSGAATPTAATSAGAVSVTAASPSTESGTSGLATILSVIAVVVAAAALLVAAMALRRRVSTGSTPPER